MFTLPNFNLLCNIWHGTVVMGDLPATPLVTAPDISLKPCQLYAASWQGTSTTPLSTSRLDLGFTMMLRVPAGTDLRDQSNASENDVVEVPAGSGRWYYVMQADDLHKGFPNEYRFGILSKLGTWPTPIP